MYTHMWAVVLICTCYYALKMLLTAQKKSMKGGKKAEQYERIR